MLIKYFSCPKPQNDYKVKLSEYLKAIPQNLMQVYAIDFNLPKKYQKRENK